MKKVLIACFTKTHTTSMIAGEIAEVLRDEGLVTDVLPLSEITRLDDWSAVVLGAPVNGMRWVPEAAAFVEKHKMELAARPVALFLVAYMLHVAKASWRARIHAALDGAKSLVQPIATGMFAGRLDKPMPFIARLLFGIPGGTAANLHDPQEVRRWAVELAKILKDRFAAD